MTFSFIIFVCLFFFFPSLFKMCMLKAKHSVPNMYSRVICKLVLNDILMSFFTL